MTFTIYQITFEYNCIIILPVKRKRLRQGASFTNAEEVNNHFRKRLVNQIWKSAINLFRIINKTGKN